MIVKKNQKYHIKHKLVTINNTINICLITDNNYFKYLLIAINSIINSKNPETYLIFYLILDNVLASNIKQLNKFKTDKIEINIINYSSSFIKLKSEESKYITNSTYIRLNIPKLLPQTIHKLLYLDVDIIVKDDLTNLFNIDLNENTIAAVRDFSMAHLHKNNKDFSYMLAYEDINYFNAGVLLLDLDKMRKDNFSELAKICYDKHQEFKFADQDILNYIYRNKTKYISCKYNFQILYYLMNNQWSYDVHNVEINNMLFNTCYKNIETLIFDVSIIHMLGNKDDMYNRYQCFRNLINQEINRIENLGIKI